MNINDLFHQYVGQAYDKQVYLADSIGVRHHWAFDVEAGTVSFNNRLTFNVQILGTHSTESNTWMWAWANTESHLPSNIIGDSERVKAYGAEHDLRPLTEGEFPVTDGLNGTVLTAIASGLCEADCSYRGSYPGGELYLLIQDERFIRSVSDPVGRITRLFPEMLTVMDVSKPKRALQHYAHSYALDVQDLGGGLVISGEGERSVHALFDENGQFTGMET